MSQRESVLEDDVCGRRGKSGIAQALGWLVRKIKWIGRRGAPDNIFGRAFDEPCPHCGAHGRVILIEFKREGKEPKGQQAREIERLRAAGFEVYVIDNERDVRRVLR